LTGGGEQNTNHGPLDMEIHMRMSETIAELATALSKAQGMIDDATKTGLNPMFKSKYADLAAVRAAVREPLAVNDLTVMQFPRTADNHVEVETMILHKSGEFVAETLRLPVAKWDAHGIGSAITYGRRYGLMAMLSIASDDDDGNAAVTKQPPPSVSDAAKNEGVIRQRIGNAAAKGNAALTEAWKALSTAERSIFGSDELRMLKASAAEADQKKDDL